MNGAAPLPPITNNSPSSSIIRMIGVSHHFLLSRMKPQICASTPPDRASDNSRNSFAMVSSVLFHRFGGIVFTRVWNPPRSLAAPKLQRIVSGQPQHPPDRREHGIKQNRERKGRDDKRDRVGQRLHADEDLPRGLGAGERA